MCKHSADILSDLTIVKVQRISTAPVAARIDGSAVSVTKQPVSVLTVQLRLLFAYKRCEPYACGHIPS